MYSGVPQGSILGPLMFVIFINDIVDIIDIDTHMVLYADDTKIWRKIEYWEDHLTHKISIDLMIGLSKIRLNFKV